MFVWIAMFVLSLGYVITPAVIALSWRIGAVDVPQDWRRMHRESIPRNGGLAVLIPFFLGVVLMDVWSPFLTAILLGGGILLLVGLTDDIFGLSAPIKLFFQIIATTCAVIVGGVAQGNGYRNEMQSRLWQEAKRILRGSPSPSKRNTHTASNFQLHHSRTKAHPYRL